MNKTRRLNRILASDGKALIVAMDGSSAHTVKATVAVVKAIANDAADDTAGANNTADAGEPTEDSAEQSAASSWSQARPIGGDGASGAAEADAAEADPR